MKIKARKPTNQFPIDDCAKAWTELTMPDRVSNVPRMQSINVVKTNQMFHTFIMPRFSCIITECKNAVPVIQGKSEAFSTGYKAQCAPSRIPTLWKHHAIMVQRRVI